MFRSVKLYVFILCNVVALNAQKVTGPICFACDRTDNPEDCRSSTTCESEMACSVQEIIAPHGVVYFWSGCESYDLCEGMAEATSNVFVVGKRSTNRCAYCCSVDLCNGNCSSFVNLAFHKPAYQSSVHSSGGTADRAVDGDTTKNYFTGQSCMCTADGEHYPWWAVDLGHEFHVTNVKLHNRDDADDGRSIHLKVEISNVNATLLPKDSPLFQTCGTYVGHSSDGNTVTIDCPRNTVGRWVRVQQTDPNYEWLQLCEVEVFGL
ncbi:pentraxin fusion protein-like [Dreissena polymorpha]|uniref:pentraxin fusion protein-like n=1 Tax=Dreissena polymorpha TaxID=45954 RepID=UPI0022650F58|nr:pentraxin fusion protein-like [Dreissena polymorpha]